LSGYDAHATEVLAGIIRELAPSEPPAAAVPLEALAL
jgi:hypothetical protein